MKNRFACFTRLVRKQGALVPAEDYMVNMDHVVLAKEIPAGSNDYARWGGDGEAPDKVYVLRFTSGHGLLVKESPWNAGWL